MCLILHDVVVARLMMVVMLACLRRARVACVGTVLGTDMLYF